MSTATTWERETAILRAPHSVMRARKRSETQHGAGSESIRLVVKTQGGVALIAIEDVECVEADGNVVLIHTADGGKHRMRESLSGVLEQLKPYGFIRLHRGTVVRATAIVAVEKGRYRKAFAVLRTGRKFEIGRVEFQRLRPLWQAGVLDLAALSDGLTLLPASR